MIYEAMTFNLLPKPIPLSEQKWPKNIQPLVTTRTMTYNHEAYIKDCLDGIIMQRTTFPVQVLIHDDASTDSTPDIVKSYAAKYPNIISLFEQPENCYTKPNKYDLRQPFYDLEKGRYIALCEGDDYWVDTLKLQKQVNLLKSDDLLSGCFHASSINYYKVHKYKVARYNKTYPFDLKYYLANDIFIHTGSIMYKREIMDPYPKWAKSYFAGDFVLKYVILLNGNFGYVDDVMSVYRKGVEGSWTNLSLTQNRIDKEYKDNIDALLKVNELSRYKFNKYVLIKLKSLFSRYISRSALALDSNTEKLIYLLKNRKYISLRDSLSVIKSIINL